MRTETSVLICAMYALSETIQSSDGVANSVIAEAAQRIDEQALEIRCLRDKLIEYRTWIDETYENRSVFCDPPSA